MKLNYLVSHKFVINFWLYNLINNYHVEYFLRYLYKHLLIKKKYMYKQNHSLIYFCCIYFLHMLDFDKYKYLPCHVYLSAYKKVGKFIFKRG